MAAPGNGEFNMTRGLLLASVAAFALAATPALSADLPASVYKAPPHAYAPTWTGFYVGAHIGAGLGTSDSNANIGGPTIAIANGSGSGVIGGGQIGYNVQSGWLVYGIEGAFTGSGISGDSPCLGTFTCSGSANWYASITGRVGGVVNDRTLAYVKGGAVWMDADYGFGIPGVFSSTASETRLGYLIGAGVEYKFNEHWSGFSEYNFMDFGRDNVDFVVPIGPGTVTSGINDTAHVFKVGVNYKLW
ncbi:MAG: porin family protein [Rhizobiales bacterium]|jgi:outer membrane immunogenic protein|nr:porin family protein [Hyphomicrobiales bacterium]